MIRMHKTSLLFFFLFLSTIFISGCDRLKAVDREIGRFISGEILGAKIEEEAPAIAASSTSPSLLTKEEKEKIDKWLEINGFNRYGDLRDAFYSSGTPLFDIKTGLTKERYEYIMEKHPDILTKI